MDRKIIWPGQVPLETDLLGTNRNVMVALGRLALDILGSSTLASGLTCTPTSPASLSVKIGPGALYSLQNIDNTAYSSMAADTADQIVKQGIILASDAITVSMSPPVSASTSIIYLIQAAFSEVDTDSTVLPYYNSSNPSVPYSGPNGSNSPNATTRANSININAKAGIPASSPVAPTPDAGFVGLYAVTLTYGQTAITSGNIAVANGAPFIETNLGNLSSALAGYLTTSAAASTYAPLSSLSNYLTAAVAASTYATIASLGDYLTSAAAASTYTPSSSFGFSTDSSGNWKRTFPDGVIEIGMLLPSASSESQYSITFPFGGFPNQYLGMSWQTINPSGSTTGDTTLQEVTSSKTGMTVMVQSDGTFGDGSGGFRCIMKGR